MHRLRLFFVPIALFVICKLFFYVCTLECPRITNVSPFYYSLSLNCITMSIYRLGMLGVNVRFQLLCLFYIFIRRLPYYCRLTSLNSPSRECCIISHFALFYCTSSLWIEHLSCSLVTFLTVNLYSFILVKFIGLVYVA